jgi:uncharacterized protein (DUF1810 family)
MAEPTATELARFRAAQAHPSWGFPAALAEVQAGSKSSHWMWYIFPQIRGLGSSITSEKYSISGLPEAEAYVRDPVLGRRLAEITLALEAHVCASPAPRSLESIFGDIDALKVVSCLTLFLEVARRCGAGAEPWVTTLHDSAQRVLQAAAREGRGPCAFTLRRLAAPSLR